MSYYVTWQKVAGKKAVRRYAVLMEKIPVPGGINARCRFYLGKDPIAKLRKLYEEGKLTREQIMSISERKLPEVRELKEELTCE